MVRACGNNGWFQHGSDQKSVADEGSRESYCFPIRKRKQLMNPLQPQDFGPAPVVTLTSQPPARLIVDSPLPEPLARGLAVIRYRTENLRILPVFGAAALDVSPRIGHLHITLDDLAWHWVDASGEPLIIQSLPVGSHRLLVELADPMHKVIDSATINFEIPQRIAPHQ